MNGRAKRPAPRRAQRAPAAASAVRRDTIIARAQRPALIQLGALLAARDSLVKTVDGYARPEQARRRLGRHLQEFERRGASARDQVARELRRRRAEVERILPAIRGRRSG